MKIETLKERIEKANAKIEKKCNTIAKKTAQIEKKETELEKMGFSKDANLHDVKDNREAYWTLCDLETLKDDIRRRTNEIKETKKTIEKYEKQLAGELEKEAIITREIPESMKQMQKELTDDWTRFDINHRDKMKKDYREMNYTDFSKKYSWSARDIMDKTDEQIRKSNERDAKTMILNLYNRVKEITGEVTDWSNIYCEPGNIGAVLTGMVYGKEGIAEVETILAGGYNIQRLHIRTLVHAR